MTKQTTMAISNAEKSFEKFIEAKGTSLSKDSIYQAELAFRYLNESVGEISELSDITPDDVHTLVRKLRSQETQDPTINKYISHLRNLYAFHQRRGNIESNPISIATDEINLQKSKSDRRHIPLDEMRKFVQSINHPEHKAIILLLLKTGIRNGELCNLDLKDININNDSYKKEYNVQPRQEIISRPNTIFVTDNIQSGKRINGEIREAGNKRKIPTIIPIDDELRIALLRYLLIRPNTSHMNAQPLFVSTHGECTRYTRDALSRLIARLAKQRGWYEKGKGLNSNVTPHYFRHYFSSHNRDGFGEAILKYIRGDVGGDIVDHYTHAWALQVKKTYLDNVYKFD